MHYYGIHMDKYPKKSSLINVVIEPVSSLQKQIYYGVEMVIV